MESNLQHRNIENCCRTCLNDLSNKMFDIFANINDSVCAAKMLQVCISVEVSPLDDLPKKLCTTCYNTVLSFYDFKIQAENVDQKLRKHLNAKQIENNDHFIEINLKNEKQDSDFDDDELEQDIIENKEIFCCTKCPSTFETIMEFENHCNYNKNKKYTTVTCEEYHKKKLHKHSIQRKCSKLNKHGPSIKTEPDGSFECDNCTATFKSMNSLCAHKRKHTDKGRVLSCMKCGKIFKKISHLKRHELTHDTRKPYKCMSCTKSFKTDKLLEEHLIIHKGQGPHKCPLCYKTYWHLAAMLNHMKKHAMGNRYLCSICGKRFSSTGNLKQHQLRHNGERSFACSMCPRNFFSKGDLKKHTITHTGERLYSCEKCHSKFTTSSSLLKHNLKHLGLKPFKCDTCPMKFTTKSHLTRHSRVHTGERPYRCEICERSFTQSNDLEKHKRSHLGNEMYECHECGQRFRLKTHLRHHVSEHFISSRLEEMRVDAEGLTPDLNVAENNMVIRDAL